MKTSSAILASLAVQNQYMMFAFGCDYFIWQPTKLSDRGCGMVQMAYLHVYLVPNAALVKQLVQV